MTFVGRAKRAVGRKRAPVSCARSPTAIATAASEMTEEVIDVPRCTPVHHLGQPGTLKAETTIRLLNAR